jgi:hypothetical protein
MTEPTTEPMTVFEARHYRDEQARLEADPNIQKMAADLVQGIANGFIGLDDITHESGAPRFEFMQRAGETAHARGVRYDSIGGPARAILSLVRKQAKAE